MVFGTGDSGEFGMGDDEKDRGEKSKPELHTWSVVIHPSSIADPGG